MNKKTGRITALSVLIILLLMAASGSTIVLAAPVDGEPFEAIMHTSGPGDYKRMWTDRQGILHIRGMAVIIYDIKETANDPSIGEGTGTSNVDYDDLSGNGYMTIWAKITLDEENYVMRASGEINDWIIQLRFVIVGREGRIIGTASAIMNIPYLHLSGTWVR